MRCTFPLADRHPRKCCGWFAAAVLTLAAVSASARAENWPGWRGPRGDGTSQEKSIPQKWSPAENIAWKVEISGKGHASPIVWEDRVFVVTSLADSEQRMLLALDRKTGKTIWRRAVLEAPLENVHRLNSRASGTPATDGELIYVSFLEPSGKKVSFKNQPGRFITPGNIVVAAYDFDGKEKWVSRPGRFSSIHGFCSSPVLWEDKVIINGDHDGQSYLAALDRATGKIVWKVERENHTRSYSTPIVRRIGDRTQMILSGNKCVASYDPADGSRHWIIDGPTEQFVASVVYNGELVFMTAGFPDRHMLAIRPDGSGNVTDSHIVWRTRESCSYVPSPIAVGPYFLVVSDSGIASCFDAETGKRHWRERMGRRFSASLVAADGLVYFTSDDGETTVVRPGPEFDVLAKNQIGELCYSSPAISGGQIFIRGEKHLFCIGR